MFKIFFLCIVTFFTTVYSQENKKADPENIIIQWENGKIKKTYYKNELSYNPDSINSLLLEDEIKRFTICIDSLKLTRMLFGKWILKDARRISGKIVDYNAPLTLEFLQNGSFIQFDSQDTVHGNWIYGKNGMGELMLEYSKPQTLIKDRNILKGLNEEILKKITYNSNIFTINFIDENILKFISSIQVGDLESTNNTYFSLVFLNYEKEY